MSNVLREYSALQAMLKVKQMAYNHNQLVDELKAILKESIPFSYHLCINDVFKHYYV